MGNQWSNLWSDNYTTADYTTIIDSDSVLVTKVRKERNSFNLKVTPDLMFYKGTDKIIMIGNYEWQNYLWQPGTDWWLGNGFYTGNFMTSMPGKLSRVYTHRSFLSSLGPSFNSKTCIGSPSRYIHHPSNPTTQNVKLLMK